MKEKRRRLKSDGITCSKMRLSRYVIDKLTHASSGRFPLSTKIIRLKMVSMVEVFSKNSSLYSQRRSLTPISLSLVKQDMIVRLTLMCFPPSMTLTSESSFTSLELSWVKHFTKVCSLKSDLRSFSYSAYSLNQTSLTT